MLKKLTLFLIIFLSGIAVYWYTFIALDEQPVPQKDIVKAYDYEKIGNIYYTDSKITPTTFQFSYKSYDGSIVNGQMSYPEKKSDSYPVLIGISAMGRSYVRWWTDSFKGRPTITQVNKITELANKKGYVVISIDARFHGTRKDPEKTLGMIMNNLHFFGDKTNYEAMIRDTVIDHRVLLDWVDQQANLNKNLVNIVGYSMGGQISLLLAAVDERVHSVISIVPPYIDDKTALVAPKNVVSLLTQKSVLLITANKDENASNEENDYLYDLIPSLNKKRIHIQSGHILPKNYFTQLEPWL